MEMEDLMTLLKNVSILKKIALIPITALVGIGVIIFFSLIFFKKIEDIGGLSMAGSNYRQSVYETSLSFERYVRTKQPEYLDQYNKNADMVEAADSMPIAVYQMLQKNDNVEEVYAEFKRKNERVHESTLSVITLFHSLMGKPQLEEIVKYISKAHDCSSNKRKLAEKFLADDGSNKEEISNQLRQINTDHLQTIIDYQKVLDGLSVYLKSTIFKIFFGITISMVVLLAIMTIIVVSAITKPLKSTVSFARVLSQGDLTEKIPIDGRDELGEMGDSLNLMSEDLGRMLREIKHGIQTLSSSSNKLSAISIQMNGDTRKTSSQSDDVANAATMMSSKMTAVAAAMEETSTNALRVATTAEEMSATIDDISINTEKARSISQEANIQAEQAALLMNELEKAAGDIGKIIVTITDISEQVNLLALNATIEAARAGEAGKGFAVVANEIKELARQTADATQDIKLKIGSIQDTTNTTISKTQGISSVIGQVNEVIRGIAAAVDEQTSATRDIATNIVQVTHGIREVGTNVNDVSNEATGINKAIAEVNTSNSMIATHSNQVKQSADDLSRLAETLGSMVTRFKL
jgi:methyl-accepting chemotaxis protein